MKTTKKLSASEIFVLNLKGLMAMQKVTIPEIATLMGISMQTFYRRVKTPYEFTLDNMERAARRLGVSPADMICKVMTVSGAGASA